MNTVKACIFPISREHVVLTCRICSRSLSFDKSSFLGKIALDIDQMNVWILCENCRDDIKDKDFEVIDFTILGGISC